MKTTVEQLYNEPSLLIAPINYVVLKVQALLESTKDMKSLQLELIYQDVIG